MPDSPLRVIGHRTTRCDQWPGSVLPVPLPSPLKPFSVNTLTEKQPVTVKLSPNSPLNQRIIDVLDSVLDFFPPQQLRKYLLEVLLSYLVHEHDSLPNDFKDITEAYQLLFHWLNVVEEEMENRSQVEEA